MARAHGSSDTAGEEPLEQRRRQQLLASTTSAITRATTWGSPALGTICSLNVFSIAAAAARYGELASRSLAVAYVSSSRSPVARNPGSTRLTATPNGFSSNLRLSPNPSSAHLLEA